MTELSGNVLVMQFGGMSAVSNVGLNALINSVLNYDNVDDVLGCIDGMYGLLSGEFIDLASQSQKNIQSLMHTPGAALGGRVADYSDEEYAHAAEILKMSEIKFLFVLGDEGSAEFCVKLEEAIGTLGYELRLILIPFSSCNTFPLTDHCLGYGSAAKYIATLFNNVVLTSRSQHGTGVVTIVELSGCSDLWLLGSAALARKRYDSQGAPHIILANVFDEQIFINKLQKTIRANGECVIAVGDNLANRAGEYIASGISTGEYVKRVVQNNFELDVDLIQLSDWKYFAGVILSMTDVEEITACAQRAAKMAIEGMVSGKMIILLRTEGAKYTSEISCVDIANTVGKKKEFPEGWYNSEEEDVDISFFKYAAPLILGEHVANYESGIPTYAKLRQLR